MNVTLALKYRPRTLADLVGQRPVRAVLGHMVRQDAVPTGLLFSGVRGSGKTTTGRILAAALNCGRRVDGGQQCGVPEDACASCGAVMDGTSLDVVEIDAASHGNVADVRALTEQLRYGVGGGTRVVLLDEAHSCSREAFNALLKTLEEPPPRTIFVLLTTEPGKIIETVQSRLMTFEFRRISPSDVVERLNHIAAAEGLDVTPELLAEIAERSSGGMRDAVMTLDQVTRVGVRTPEQLATLLGDADAGPELVAAMVAGDPAAVFAVVDRELARTGDPTKLGAELVACLRDVLVVRAGGELVRAGAARDARVELARRVDTARAVAAMKVLWDLRTRVRLGDRAADDARATLELAVTSMTDMLSGNALSSAASTSRPTAATGTGPASRTLTLDQLRSS